MLAVQTGTKSADMRRTEPDRISLPPVRLEQLSPNRKFQFVISSKNSWKTAQPDAFLYQLSGVTGGGPKTLLWNGRLPQQYGPRYTLVSPTGEVLLLDEYLNINSQQAIYLIHGQPRKTTAYRLDDIVKILGLPPARLTEKAKGGSWWISAAPTLAPAGDKAFVPTGGKMLVVHLATGRLSVK